MNVRENTCKLLVMVDEGLIDPMDVLSMALSYMSEADVTEMMEMNGLDEELEYDL